MAYPGSMFRPIFAAAVAFLVGCAVFVHDRIHDLVTYAGHSLFSDAITLDHRTRLHVESMERELRSETLELTPLGERFKAFIRRRLEHDNAIGDGFNGRRHRMLPA